MNTLLLIVIALGILTVGALTGMWAAGRKITALSDIYAPKPGRSAREQSGDAVMQLQNEIEKSGALKLRKLPDGKVRVTLKVVR